MYYKHITIINYNSRVIRMALQAVVSPMIVILTTLEVSFTLLGNIYSTGITLDGCNIFIVQATGPAHKYQTRQQCSNNFGHRTVGITKPANGTC